MNLSCFGELWKINKIKSAYFRTKAHICRPDEILVLGDGLGSVEVTMNLETIRKNRNSYNFEIVVTMKFRGIPVNSYIKIDFFVVCGDIHHDIKSTLAEETVKSEKCLTRRYQCYKENLESGSNLTPNDSLTLAVRYNISPAVIEVPIRKTTRLDTNPIIGLERLFNEDKFADFVFSVQGVEFKVHKAIIAIRSSVFEAMMEHDMKEKSENRAEITDVDPAVFKEMLRYIYTGKVENLATVVDGLIVVADKYDLGGLKDICEDNLSEGLCPENAIELLKQADVFNCERLKAQTLEFIIRNIARVSDTDAWKNLASRLPAKLISEICFSMSKEMVAFRCERKTSGAESDIESNTDPIEEW